MVNYMDTMVTTIQISESLRDELKKRKAGNESYEDVLWDLLEDTMELSDEMKRDIAEAEADIAAGRVITHEQLKKELGIK